MAAKIERELVYATEAEAMRDPVKDENVRLYQIKNSANNNECVVFERNATIALGRAARFKGWTAEPFVKPPDVEKYLAGLNSDELNRLREAMAKRGITV